MLQIFTNNIVKYKILNNIPNKIVKILNNNMNNVKVTFEINNNLLEQIIRYAKNFTKMSLTFDNAGVYKLNFNCNFIMVQQIGTLKLNTKRIF